MSQRTPSPHAPQQPHAEETAQMVAEIVVVYQDTVFHVSHPKLLEEGESTLFTIGEHPEASFVLPLSGTERHVLASAQADCVAVHVPAGATGSVRGEGDVAGPGSMKVRPGQRAQVQLGELRFLIRPVFGAKASATRSPADRALWMTTGLSAISAATFGTLLALIPSDADSMSSLDDESLARFVGYLHQPVEKEDIEEDTPEAGEESRADTGAAARRGESGMMGNPTSSKKAGRMAIARKTPEITFTRNFNTEMDVRQAGILGMVSAHQSSVFADMNSSAFLTSGADDADVWGGLNLGDVAEGYGVGGLGPVGTGRGGGGNADGVIGLAGAGDLGVLRRTGNGTRYNRGGGGVLDGRKARQPVVRIAKHEVSPGIDKDVIRRVVRSHLNEVRHCYNQGLSRDPRLGGRVKIQFTIGPTGKVALAVVESSSVKDENVGRCIAGAVKRWRFPRPETGAGTVIVSYPFLLAADS